MEFVSGYRATNAPVRTKKPPKADPAPQQPFDYTDEQLKDLHSPKHQAPESPRPHPHRLAAPHDLARRPAQPARHRNASRRPGV